MALLLYVILSTAAAGALAAEDPWFCRGKECPAYKVVDSHSEYEVRRYSASRWASTRVEGVYKSSYKAAYKTLTDYFNGANNASLHLNATLPVRVLHESDGIKQNNFTVSFYLPLAFQHLPPPAPTDSGIFFETERAFTAYVYAYGGWTSLNDIVAKADTLYDILDDKDIDVEAEFYSAIYQSPLRILQTHNEVWLIGKADNGGDDDDDDDDDDDEGDDSREGEGEGSDEGEGADEGHDDNEGGHDDGEDEDDREGGDGERDSWLGGSGLRTKDVIRQANLA